MECETIDAARSTPTRHEKSLGLLTMKFVGLLQEANDGVLDLKMVSVNASELFFSVFREVRFTPSSRCETKSHQSPNQGGAGGGGLRGRRLVRWTALYSGVGAQVPEFPFREKCFILKDT